METLEAKTRDMGVKAKKLRREGWITGSISGHELDQSISLQIDKLKADRFLSGHGISSTVMLEIDGKKYPAMVRAVDRDPLSAKVIDMDFLQLVADEKVKGTAEIVLLNEDKARGFVTHDVSFIDYKAYPKDLVDRIEINCGEYPVGTDLTVKDLDIAKNKDIDILTQRDLSVMHVAVHQHMNAADEAMLEEAEEAAAEKSAS